MTFRKEHKHVLEKIEKLIRDCSDDLGRSNFRPSSYVNSQNKTQPMYEMTCDGWIFLVMGFGSAHFAQLFSGPYNKVLKSWWSKF